MTASPPEKDREQATGEPAAQTASGGFTFSDPIYLDVYASIAGEMCKLGVTDENFACAFNVSERTIAVWKAEHPPFAEACREGTQMATEQVRAAVLQRAMGCTEVEQKVVLTTRGPILTENRKQCAPDMGAARFFTQHFLSKERPYTREDAWREFYDQVKGHVLRPKDPDRKF